MKGTRMSSEVLAAAESSDDLLPYLRHLAITCYSPTYCVAIRRAIARIEELEAQQASHGTQDLGVTSNGFVCEQCLGTFDDLEYFDGVCRDCWDDIDTGGNA